MLQNHELIIVMITIVNFISLELIAKEATV